MKIAFVGTANTGKTTFINDIIKEFPIFHKSKFTYRDAIKNSGIQSNINRKTCIESQLIIFNALCDEVINADDNTLLDRCVIDALAYTIWPNKYSKDETDITNRMIDIMMGTTKKMIDLYDLIVYIPIDVDIEVISDNFRDTDLTYRKQIDDIFNEILFNEDLFDIFGYKVITITGSREDRVDQFRCIYNALKNII